MASIPFYQLLSNIQLENFNLNKAILNQDAGPQLIEKSIILQKINIDLLNQRLSFSQKGKGNLASHYFNRTGPSTAAARTPSLKVISHRKLKKVHVMEQMTTSTNRDMAEPTPMANPKDSFGAINLTIGNRAVTLNDSTLGETRESEEHKLSSRLSRLLKKPLLPKKI